MGALGFIAGGALKGIGDGMVEESKRRWEEMVRAEDRAERKADRDLRREEGAAERAIQKENLAETREDRKLAREERKADREETREDRKLARESNAAERQADREQREEYNRERLDIEREKATGTGQQKAASDDTIIDRIERSAERQAKNIMGEIDQPKYDDIVKKKAAKYKDRPDVMEYFGITPEEPAPKNTDGQEFAPPEARGGVPGFGAGAAKPAGEKPGKPAEYPDAQWSDKADAWVVQKNGKWYAVE